MTIMPFVTRHRSSLLLAVVLVFTAIVIARGITRGEFHLNTDEGYHATTGLYIVDFLRDLPLAHPVRYTYEYYAQYPALGLIHWPPFFYFVEGAIFLLAGPSVVSARVTVLFFAIFGLYFWFKLVKELENEWTAAVSTLVMACIPSILLYEKAVMLEIPSLALCIAATYFWFGYLERAESRSLYFFVAFASVAQLTKQQSVYLALLCLFTIIATRKWRQLLSRSTLWAIGISLLIVGPFYALNFGIDRKSVAANLLKGAYTLSNPLTFYLQELPHQLGWILLGLSILGVLTCSRWANKQSAILMFSWIVAWYVTYLIIGTKTTRYMVYWLPAFVFFAVGPLTSPVLPKRIRAGTALVALALAGGYGWIGWTYERPYVTGYRTLASDVLNNSDGGVVLFDGDLEANFIFFMRAMDPHRRFVILRKALYVTSVMPQFESVELVHSTGDIEDILDQYGIRYVAVESNTPLRFNSQKILRDLLTTPQFALVRSIPIKSNIPDWRARSLLLYENLQVKPRATNLLHLRMLSMSHDIVVSLDNLLKR